VVGPENMVTCRSLGIPSVLMSLDPNLRHHRDELSQAAVLFGHIGMKGSAAILMCSLGLGRRHSWARWMLFAQLGLVAVLGLVTTLTALAGMNLPLASVGLLFTFFGAWHLRVIRRAFDAYRLSGRTW
jgi:hypothetical protein